MSDNNSSGKFVSADTTKIANFEKQSAEVITEFATIKNEFNRINKELLASWKGVGADAYSTETAHILEKIGSVEDVLKAINESAVKILEIHIVRLMMNWENLIEILIPERRSKMVDLTDAQFACSQTNSTSNNVFLKKLDSNDPDTIFNKVIMEFNEEENDD